MDLINSLIQCGRAVGYDGKWQITLPGQYTLNHHTRYKDGLESLTKSALLLTDGLILPHEYLPHPGVYLDTVDRHVVHQRRLA